MYVSRLLFEASYVQRETYPAKTKYSLNLDISLVTLLPIHKNGLLKMFYGQILCN